MREFTITESELEPVSTNLPIHIYYDRGSDGYGVPIENPVTWKAHPEMVRCLERFVEMLITAFGDHFTAMLSGGMRYDRHIGSDPTKPLSPHHIARGATADDLDGFIVRDPISDEKVIYVYDYRKAWPNASQLKRLGYSLREPSDRMKTRVACLSYLAGFTTNLTWDYHNHGDHIHRDLLNEPGWHGYKSQIIHVQECLNAWTTTFPKLTVDGVLGQKTYERWNSSISPVEDPEMDCSDIFRWNYLLHTIAGID